jgi:hypothetical protein
MKHILIGLSLAAALAGCSRGGSPAAVVEEFARKMESGSCSGVQDSLAASSRAMAGPKLEQACQAAAEMKKNDPKAKDKTIKSMRVVESKEEGDRATVRMETEYSDGTKSGADQAITLVKEDGRWKIDLMATGMAAGGNAGPAPGMTPPPSQQDSSAPTPAEEAPAEEASNATEDTE